ncbi:hypothetical protein Btru_066472 [Bulinus truncatus]|nr:hypothetical protein Btru_066472 [Bulinus truncatus]
MANKANTEKFIDLVKSFPILYDLSRPDYKNCRKKDKIFEEIGKMLNKNGWSRLYWTYIVFHHARQRVGAKNLRRRHLVKYLDEFFSSHYSKFVQPLSAEKKCEDVYRLQDPLSHTTCVIVKIKRELEPSGTVLYLVAYWNALNRSPLKMWSLRMRCVDG